MAFGGPSSPSPRSWLLPKPRSRTRFVAADAAPRQTRRQVGAAQLPWCGAVGDSPTRNLPERCSSRTRSQLELTRHLSRDALRVARPIGRGGGRCGLRPGPVAIARDLTESRLIARISCAAEWPRWPGRRKLSAAVRNRNRGSPCYAGIFGLIRAYQALRTRAESAQFGRSWTVPVRMSVRTRSSLVR